MEKSGFLSNSYWETRISRRLLWVFMALVLQVAIALAASYGMAYSYFFLVGQACAIGIMSSFAFTTSPIRWVVLAVACPYFSSIVYSEGIYNTESLTFFLILIMFMSAGFASVAGLGIALLSGQWKKWKWGLRVMILEISGVNFAFATFIWYIPGHVFIDVTIYDESPELLAMALLSWPAIAAFLLMLNCHRQVWRNAILIISVPISAVLYYCIMVSWLSKLSYGIAACTFLHGCVFCIVLWSLYFVRLGIRRDDYCNENVTPSGRGLPCDPRLG